MSDRLRLTACEVDLVLREVHGARPCSLTPHEAALLAFLVAHPDEPVSRERLLREVWGYREGVDSPTVFNTMRRLREKVEADPSEPTHLLTVRGSGYRFQPLQRAPRAGPLGREPVLRQVEDALGRGGVTTLLGPGGIGKTTVARAIAAAWPGPVRFCERAEPADADGLLAALATGTGADRPTLDAILGAVGALHAGLLVVDDLDDVVDAAAPMLARLARVVPVLATSRSPLRIEAEREIWLGPLASDDAVALLRARSPRPLVASEGLALVRLASFVEGVPLALELAAGRLRVLPADELADRLERGLELRSDRRDLPDRHGSLEAAIRGSVDALDETAAAAFSTCGLFRGAFDLAAAEAVLGTDAADLLHGLQTRSLLQVRSEGFGPEYRMFRSIAAFARARLDAETASATAIDLALHLAARLGALAASGSDEARARIAGAHDLVETVLAEARGPAVTEVVLACRSVLSEREPAAVAARWLDRAVEEAAADQRPVALLARAQARIAAGSYEAAESNLRAVAAATTGDEPERLARAALLHNTRGTLLRGQGDLEGALAAYREARSRHEALGDRKSVGSTDGRIGLVLEALGARPEALRHLNLALAVHREVGNRLNEANVLVNRATLLGTHDDGVVADLELALELARSVGSRRVEAHARAAWARVLERRADPGADAAFAQAREAYAALGWRLDGLDRDSAARA